MTASYAFVKPTLSFRRPVTSNRNALPLHSDEANFQSNADLSCSPTISTEITKCCSSRKRGERNPGWKQELEKREDGEERKFLNTRHEDGVKWNCFRIGCLL